MKYVALLRGINVGGNTKVSMAELRACLEALGYDQVATYINSGNVLFASSKSASTITKEIEKALPGALKLKEPIKILVVSHDYLRRIIDKAPEGFGQQPTVYHSDVAFLMGVSSADAMKDVEVNPEVDVAWSGEGVIYYQRLSAKRTKSRLSRTISKPVYKSMTIRSWSTVRKLDNLMESET